MSDSEDSEIDNKNNNTNKKTRQYERCSNSVLCIFCNQYHQKKKEGKCNSFKKELPLFTDFIRDHDSSDVIKNKIEINSSTVTEVSLRRIMAFVHEHRDQYKLWSTKTDYELGPERPNISRVSNISPMNTFVQKNNNNNNNNHTNHMILTNHTSHTNNTTNNTTNNMMNNMTNNTMNNMMNNTNNHVNDSEDLMSYVPSNDLKGPAPRLLSYEYLKNIDDIHYQSTRR